MVGGSISDRIRSDFFSSPVTFDATRSKIILKLRAVILGPIRTRSLKAWNLKTKHTEVGENVQPDLYMYSLAEDAVLYGDAVRVSNFNPGELFYTYSIPCNITKTDYE